jgi:hypothetical protein
MELRGGDAGLLQVDLTVHLVLLTCMDIFTKAYDNVKEKFRCLHYASRLVVVNSSSLLGCYTVSLGKQTQTFHMTIVPLKLQDILTQPHSRKLESAATPLSGSLKPPILQA